MRIFNSHPTTTEFHDKAIKVHNPAHNLEILGCAHQVHAGIIPEPAESGKVRARIVHKRYTMSHANERLLIGILDTSNGDDLLRLEL